MAEIEYVEPVLSSDRIRGCAQVVRDYQVRIGGSRFEWADITDPLADVLDGLAVRCDEIHGAGWTLDLNTAEPRALDALLEAIEAAVRHT